MSSDNQNLNIGIVCYPTHGGSGVVAVELAHGLADLGHNVHIISYSLPARLDTLRSRISFHQVNVPDYPLFEYPPYSLALAAKLAEVISEFNLDVLHAHYAIPHAVSGWLSRKMANRHDLPLITTLHGTDITIVGNDPSYLPITRWSLEASDSVTVVSNWLGEEVKRKIGCKCDPKLIYNFVDSERYHPDKTKALDYVLYGNIPVIMHMSNFRPVKRVNDVVEAFLQVREKVPAQLVMVGNGPDLPAAERKLKNSSFASDVHFLGLQDKAENLLPCADLFLFPSNAESFGLAALEAMSCGVPVVGANAGGLPEVVEHGKSGMLVEPEDVNGLAGACVDLLTDSQKLTEMKNSARERASTVFTDKKTIDEYVDEYRRSIELIKTNGPKENSVHLSKIYKQD